ncbi:MAG: myo-inosose-2 dehydratase [bacterium]
MSTAVRVGVNPIVWSNDDFHDLGGDIPLSQCLAEARAAGYAGIELGHKFPREPERLRPLLDDAALDLVSGWHSLRLLDQPIEEERVRFRAHADFLWHMGCSVVIVAECSRCTYTDPKLRLRFPSANGPLSEDEWSRLAAGLDELAEAALARDMAVAYHPHVGTVVQSREEIDRLMESTRSVGLLADSGHVALAGADPLAVFRDHADRIAHVHLKNVRADVARRVRDGDWSFSRAVREGVFTVPGDGGIDYQPIFGLLEEIGYSGWLVVEAEQDPAKATPSEYAETARRYIRRATGL